MGTHPIFESDFDCLTENMNKHGEDETCVLWCGNLDLQVTQEHLYELMMQAGPVEKVTKPKEKNFAFILFKHRETVGYALKVLDGIELFERRLNMRQRETGARNNRDDSTQRHQERDRSSDGRHEPRSHSPPLWKEPRLDRGRQVNRNGDGWGRYDDQYQGRSYSAPSNKQQQQQQRSHSNRRNDGGYRQ